MVLERRNKSKKVNFKLPISTKVGDTQLIDELKGIKAFELVSKATNVFEKIVWGVVFIGGMIWAAQWLVKEFQSWQDHPTIISNINVKWADIPNPAITFCPQGSTKFAIAERLGNYINANHGLPDKLLEIRKLLLKQVLGSMTGEALPTEDVPQACPFFGCKRWYENFCLRNSRNERTCKLIKLLYDSGIAKNYTMKKIYEESMNHVLININKMNHWNASDLFFQFLKEKLDLHLIDSIQEDVDLNNISFSNNDWPYVIANANNIFSLNEYANLFDWSTTKIGTFFVKALPIIYKRNLKSIRNKPFMSLIIQALHHLFTIPEQKMSLIDISYLYSLMDLKAIDELYTPFNEDLTRTKRSVPPPPPLSPPQQPPKGDDSTFWPCLKMISNKMTNSNSVKNGETSTFTRRDNYDHMPILPCNNLTQYPVCTEYCQWHKNYFKQWPREEFLTIMRYAMPQRKLILEQVPHIEQRMVKEIFGKGNVKDLKNDFQFWAPVSMAIFCHNVDEGFVGDDIGISEKVCNDFFPTPSDIGICQTKNLDIKQLMNDIQNYEVLFESEKQKSETIYHEGKSWDEITLGILTDKTELQNSVSTYSELFGQSYPTKKDADVGKIRFQIHQSKEIPSILQDYYIDNKQEPSLGSLTLEAGNEYVIQVYPSGLASTEQYKSISLENRGCKLEHEVNKSSTFKVYTKNNCKYECHVKLIGDLCKCIPWEFIHNTNASECDIFGRTCFFKTMEDINKYPGDKCNCMKECDFINYNKMITHSNNLIKSSSWIKKDKLDGDYFSFKTTNRLHGYYFSNDVTGNFEGRKEFVDFFSDTNNTFHDQGFKNLISLALAYDNMYNLQRAKLYENLIIIRLKLTPLKEMPLVDVKYSTMDRFASFGGNFGIFAEITGCSFLGFMSILIILSKLLFKKFVARTICPKNGL